MYDIFLSIDENTELEELEKKEGKSHINDE